VTSLPASIQGERQREEDRSSAYAPMSASDVEQYVDSHSDEVVQCRERGRHDFPTVREAAQGPEGFLDDYDAELGLFVQRDVCRCCGLVERKTHWQAVKRGKRTEWFRVGRPVLDYHRQARIKGESYAAPVGLGVMRPTQVMNAVATRVMAGQSAAALRKTFERARKDGES